MEKTLLDAGVDIATGAHVSSIQVDQGRVVAVDVEGRRIAAKSVISNANLKHTILGMLPTESLPPEFVTQVQEMRLSSSSTQVYIGLKDGVTIPHIGDLLFTSTATNFSSDELKRIDTQSRTFSLYYPETRPGHDRYTIVASSNASYDDW